MVKLNKSRIRWLVRQVVRDGRKPLEVACVYNVGVRRVQQLVKKFKDSGIMPGLRKERRPKTFLDEEQKKGVDLAFEQG